MTDNFNSPKSRIVPMKLRDCTRFYEPVVLLACLQNTYYCWDYSAEPTVSSGGSQEEIFYYFVNKFSLICDSGMGGATGTSFAVLQPGIVQYRFASNSRTTKALEDVKAYIVDILKTIGCAAESVVNNPAPQSPLFSEVLQKIIQFNRPRIEFYTRMAAIEIGICIERVSHQETDDTHAASQDLSVLRPLIEFAARISRDDNAEFIAASQSVIYAIHSPYHSDSHSLREFIRYQAGVNCEGPKTSWRRLRHALGRFHSYLNAVRVFFCACRLWPSLFVNFEVVSILSSEPDPRPLRIRTSADGIFRRMTRDPDLINLYRNTAPSLHALGLDARIMHVAKHRTFKPVVHAEVLLDDSIRRSDRLDSLQGRKASPFFSEGRFGRYIGSSKPTCHLCALYFAARSVGADSVRVRASHHRLYYNWRLPDVLENDDKEVELQRSADLKRMIKALRNETFTAIRSRLVLASHFDSDDSLSDTPLGNCDGATVTMAIPGRDDMNMAPLVGEALVRGEEAYSSTLSSTLRASPERSSCQCRSNIESVPAYIDAQAARL
ncbi:hypothetical protein MFIFM68171_06280 [Madurella fahalii]|uniref:Uncharacterized protein n=1 Tax=Madurella fahalii TaxID=1157608 RepID=A0ABQ0GE71_9PEZI